MRKASDPHRTDIAMTGNLTHCTAFQGLNRLASGTPAQVALSVKAALARQPDIPVLVFDDETGRQMDFNLRGTKAEVLAPAEAGEAERPVRGRGRPRLGVIAREVTLLPRHWDWLNEQPGGASVALRRLVEAARMTDVMSDQARLARQAANRFMAVMAGNQSGYEEASRALYAGDWARFEAETAAWPHDVRDHARCLAQAGFAQTAWPTGGLSGPDTPPSREGALNP
jgi:uncharacterized protein